VFCVVYLLRGVVGIKSSCWLYFGGILWLVVVLCLLVLCLVVWWFVTVVEVLGWCFGWLVVLK